MDIKIIILIEVNHRKTSDMTYTWNWKKIDKWIHIQNRNKLTDIENRLVVAKGDGEEERIWLGVWDYQRQIIIYRMDKYQGPIESTGDYI